MTAPILLTGFQPFGDNAVNPTALLMERLAGEPGVVTAVLPVEYDVCGAAFATLVEEHRPAAALCFGLAGNSDYIKVERLAWNRDESDKPDNAGVVRTDSPIEPDGPTAYGSALPIPMVMRELAIAGLPVTFSDFAGGFVCNHLFYRARHLIETRGLDLPMGFIHLPPLPEQVAGQSGRVGLRLERQELAVRTLVGLLQQGLGETA
ncbi:pyroglutamyl-peptidase I [Azospirillum rugosum]|uniref:Pyrrolidone-carboxylate peptidase n=1 Tax=Azospirillum rugosum TaxID=416170 RepID=A0ABS4SPX4_9PROT|nr:pyroglutamyl-peptidase I [Azospirillum rugosum]MBP2294007.1 pyroglutamyl-peptidase [Azospirillum rugosum]MDQ0526806.1 pyroglutamyl-peptidase [Azospirillum rugosum]